MSLAEKIASLEFKLAEKGPRGGEIIGKTQSGKPIYKSHGNVNHKNFTKKDHLDAAQHHSWLASRASDEHRNQHNGDGTYSAAHAKKKKQLEKVRDHHRQQAARHIDSHEGNKNRIPDQRDFDRADRQNDPDKRSKSWKHYSAEIEAKLTGTPISHTLSGKHVFKNFDHPAHKSFTSHDHIEAVEAHRSQYHKAKDPATKQYHIGEAKKHQDAAV